MEKRIAPNWVIGISCAGLAIIGFLAVAYGLISLRYVGDAPSYYISAFAFECLFAYLLAYIPLRIMRRYMKEKK